MRAPTTCAEALDAITQTIAIRHDTSDDPTMPWTRIRQKMLDAKVRAEKSPANWSNIAYDPNPPLLVDELEAIEAELGFRFPDDYRSFVTIIGDGGVGPGYGLFPLRKGIAERHRPIYGLDEPYEPPTSVRECQNLEMPGMHLVTHDGCAYYTGLAVSGPAAGTMWSYVEVAPGWIPLLDGGCVDDDGQPYSIEGSDHEAYVRLYDMMLRPHNVPRRMTFLTWYENWLDGVLQHAG